MEKEKDRILIKMLTHGGLWMLALLVAVIYVLFTEINALIFVLVWLFSYLIFYIVLVVPKKYMDKKKGDKDATD